jgi:hypothetical protein
VNDLLDELAAWVTAHGGVWGTRMLALLSVLLGYGLVWAVISSLRGLVRRLSRPPEGESRTVVVIAALVRCGIAVALLTLFVRAAIRRFPDWLGI